jgi:hypothetical protein
MPSTSTNNGLVRWTYGDWRRMPTLDRQIDRLVRHIEEVERYAFDSQSKGQRLALQQNMLERLNADLRRLEARRAVNSRAAFNRVGKVSAFVRGDGP